jgi:hypothetical protein
MKPKNQKELKFIISQSKKVGIFLLIAFVVIISLSIIKKV